MRHDAALLVMQHERFILQRGITGLVDTQQQVLTVGYMRYASSAEIRRRCAAPRHELLTTSVFYCRLWVASCAGAARVYLCESYIGKPTGAMS